MDKELLYKRIMHSYILIPSEYSDKDIVIDGTFAYTICYIEKSISVAPIKISSIEQLASIHPEFFLLIMKNIDILREHPPRTWYEHTFYSIGKENLDKILSQMTQIDTFSDSTP